MAEEKKPQKKRTYDPQKAHEYYMKHRKLKGRKKSTSSKKSSSKKSSSKVTTDGLNEAGKAAALQAEAKMNVLKKDLTAQINKAMKERIAEVQKAMATMTDQEKAIAAEAVRMEYEQMKKAATDQLKQNYAAEVNALKADAQYKA